ncbi:U7 snRNA-associated Sm-like protein LSm11 isoform X2 [Acanthaster planci]|uniref:U7 snRNA-associated Sm-like protein LSm11 isoform X2 n=1 Tax=Acanthaster planci TaxID=133434 RepID=A0A8B7YJU3_ACAPL|nr:U7 snRNA-associated Sm-like protein LSm11 isoform X2 [Acanthaster planci]
MRVENMSDPNSEDESGETNLLSPNFNPLKALYSSGVQLPFPGATIFNNLFEYERITAARNRGDCSYVSASSHGSSADGNSGRSLPSSQGKERTVQESYQTGSISRTRRKEQVPLGRGFRATQEMLIDTAKNKPRTFRNVLTRMSEYSSGPLSMLYRCMNERCKVRVCTRSFKGLRSICTGYLVTFDKFFNMALTDVDEVWRRLSTGQRFYHEETVTFSKIMDCSRTLESADSGQMDKSGTKETKEIAQLKEAGTSSQKKPQTSEHLYQDKHTKDSSSVLEREDRRHSAKDVPSESHQEDGRRSEKSKHRGLRQHRQKEERPSKTREGKERQKSSHRNSPGTKERTKKSSPEPDKGRSDDEDIEDLQQRLAALQRELTSLSADDEKAGDTGISEHLAAVHDFGSSSEVKTEGSAQLKEVDEVRGVIRTTRRDSRSQDRISQHPEQVRTSAEGPKEVQGQESGQRAKGDRKDNFNLAGETRDQPSHSTSTDTNSKVKPIEKKDSAAVGVKIKKGRLQIKAEEFQRRHVNQLFIRGDNVVLVSVDSILLPK